MRLSLDGDPRARGSLPLSPPSGVASPIKGKTADVP